jgi:DNA modification methylase
MILHGDSIDKLKELEANSVDTIITDPPYGLSFMGKKWDYDVPSVELWQEALRVLKPGGTMLCFAGSRTQHRMAVNVEDAGFELKDCIMWLYGSGFPKATDISKQLDKVQGRSFEKQLEFTKFLRTNKGDYTNNQLDEILGLKEGAFHFFALSQSNNSIPRKAHYLKFKELFGFGDEWDTYIEEAEREVVGKQENAMSGWNTDGSTKFVDRDITKPKTPEAQAWEGWKSHGLKPAYEPILVAVKPNDGTYANNALKWGVSGLNIDGGRVPHQNKEDEYHRDNTTTNESFFGNAEGKMDRNSHEQGRFPANIILDEEAGEMLDEQSGELKPQGNKLGKELDTNGKGSAFGGGQVNDSNNYKDKGGASRFFYCAKASKSERNAGCEGLPEREKAQLAGANNNKPKEDLDDVSARYRSKPMSNIHPTVKPLKLMEYLCTLTKTPTGGIVLDPFAGSGTTLLAAKNVGRDYIGIEREEEYIEIIKARLND